MPKILYVDDEPFLRNTVQRMLKRAGYEFVGAESGADGITKVSNDSFDLVLSDVQMPKMSGVEMVQRLRASGCKLPIVFMSGNTGEHEVLVQQMLVEGVVQGFVHKPFEAGTLLNTIADLLMATGAIKHE